MINNPPLHIDGTNAYIGNKVIARISQEFCIIERNKERHFYRTLNAWCINYELIKEAIERNIPKLQIVDKKFGNTYEIELAEIRNLMRSFNAFISFGNEKQIAVPLSLWDIYETRKGKDHLKTARITIEQLIYWSYSGKWAQRLKKTDSRDQQEIFGGLHE
jgi:hypothetical protein